MPEIRTGFRNFLSNPTIYTWLMGILSSTTAQYRIVNDYIRPSPKMRLLDIGCGPADILAYLPEDIQYVGFDASQQYVESAKKRFTHRGFFYQENVNEATIKEHEKFDLVMAIGVMHHLDDREVKSLSKIAWQALRPGGRFLTIDPCYVVKQNKLARFIISKDRGQNVRSPDQYTTLITKNSKWDSPHTISVIHDLLCIPYTHSILECKKNLVQCDLPLSAPLL